MGRLLRSSYPEAGLSNTDLLAYDVVGPCVPDAVLDRLVHTAHRLDLDGPSLRDPKARTTAAPVTTQVIGELATKPTKGAKK